MKVIKRSCDLPIAVLHAHPDNPRKDVGDVTELAESIKQNGIFQNLTVVKGGKGSPNADGYTVIIGHRRLTAAARAGLTKVPCMVVDMDDKEQLSTMLLENMQRNDLTIWEQAQGFQMMLDLGESEVNHKAVTKMSVKSKVDGKIAGFDGRDYFAIKKFKGKFVAIRTPRDASQLTLEDQRILAGLDAETD